MKKTLRSSAYVPFDPDAFLYVQSEGHALSGEENAGYHPFEYTGWWDECLSWQESCYIHAGLNPMPTYRLRGPDALALLKKYCVNSFEKFPVGKGKHGIMCDENGYIVHDGICLRTGEDEFLTFCMWPYLGYAAERGGFDVQGELLTGKTFLYQLCGPRALEIVEAAANEDLHDIKFMNFRQSTVAGKSVRVLRAGMAGKLGYEVHGDAEDALAVYDALLKAGEQFGLRRIGRHAYRNTHTEGGFPQASIHFWYTRPDAFAEYFSTLDIWGMNGFRLSGSAAGDPSLYVRTPYDVGWDKMVKFDHDFIGRAALERIAEAPPHRMVTLVWNADDCAAAWRSAFDKNVRFTMLDMAEDSSYTVGQSEMHNDLVEVGGRRVGVSSGRVFSPYYREMVSLCTIDAEYAELGREVEIIWGDVGNTQLKIRAVVSRFPYVDVDRNERLDVASIPRLKKT